MRREIEYPFIPKSNTYLRPGHFWQILLSDNRFACGRILQIGNRQSYGSRVSILAGLIDWSGDTLPTSEAISRCKLLEQGDAHIKTIAWNGGQILGYRPLDADGIEPFYVLSHSPSPNCMLQKGLEVIRRATLEEQHTLKVHSTWGLAVIKILAEIYFVEKRKP